MMTGDTRGHVPQGMSDAEQSARQARRIGLDVDAEAPWYGLALSGGGIRSATFCLGLLRALARNGVLKRFDYLSTVSGGGYAGSAWGRLYQGAATAKTVEAGVANDHSLWLWWLRQNGRFLTPSGARDLFKAWTTQFRGFIATHMEIAFISLLVGCLVAGAHMLYAHYTQLAPGWPIVGSAWFWALGVLLPSAAAMMCGYWFLGRGLWAGIAVGILAILIALALFHTAHANPNWSLRPYAMVAGRVFLIVPCGFVIACIGTLVQRDAGTNRVRFNTILAWIFGLTFLVIALGCLDLTSWAIRSRLIPEGTGSDTGGVFTGAGIATVLLAAIRAAAPAFMPRDKDNGRRTTIPWMLIAQCASYALFALVILFWTTLVQVVVFPRSVGDFPEWLQSDIARAGCLVVPVLLYMLATGQSLEFLNQSSLHMFYRSRLARTYVATGNDTGASPRFPANVLSAREQEIKGKPLTELTRKATELVPGDDIRFAAYQPHANGGPIHVVNVCINQTVDDRTGTFNADRKGVALSVSAFGPEVGTAFACPSTPDFLKTTLAEWIAISGAAVGSGMGTYTRSALAALLFVSGLRLGYWQTNLRTPPKGIVFLEKYRAMMRECLGMFPGLNSAKWYLSDGGHFDNTGVYALLKRQLDLIVLADCGADPDYVFGDVENLVRKARIDYQCAIEFIDPVPLIAANDPLAPWLATPTTMSSAPGDECLLLARVTYAPGVTGALLIVKPRVPTEFDLDTTAYAERQPPFPQQSTAQQFFSEEQWESYCHLGTGLGAILTSAQLSRLPALVATAAVANLPAGKLAPRKPVRRRRSTAATVGASLGLGAILTAAIAIWQAWDAQTAVAARLAKDAAKQADQVTAQIRKVRDDFKVAAPDADRTSDDLADLAKLASNATLTDDNRTDMSSLQTGIQTRCPQVATMDASTCQNMLNTLTTVLTISPDPWTSLMDDYRGWNNPQPDIASAAQPPPAPPPAPEVSEDVFTTQSVIVASAARPDASPARSQSMPVQDTAPALVAPTALSDDVRAACGNDQSTTIYTQIYGEGARHAANGYATSLKLLGLRAPGIENVTATATRRGTRTPFQWDRPTLLYAGANGARCAAALTAWARSVPSLGPQTQALPLPQGRGKAGVIELWLPGQ